MADIKAKENLVAGLINNLIERIPVLSQQGGNELKHDIGIAKTVKNLIVASFTDFDQVLNALIGILFISTESKDVQKRNHSVGLVIKIITYCLALYWRQYSLTMDTKLSESGNKPTLGGLFNYHVNWKNSEDDFEVDGDYDNDSANQENMNPRMQSNRTPLTTLHELPVQNEQIVSKLLKAILPIISFQALKVNWDNFPYSWYKDNPNNQTISLDRATYFYKHAFTNETLDDIVDTILTSNENDNSESTKYVNYIIFFLSTSNWNTVYKYLQATLNGAHTFVLDDVMNAAGGGHKGEFTIAKALESCNLNESRLVACIQEFMKYYEKVDSHIRLLMSVIMRSCISHWIIDYPEEYLKLLNEKRNLIDKPERITDIIFDAGDSSKKRASYWPFLTTVYLVSFGDTNNNGKNSKKSIFSTLFDSLRKSLKSKTDDVAVFCFTEVFRAFSVVKNVESSPVKTIIRSIEDDFYKKLFDGTKSVPTTEPDNILDERVVMDALCSIFRIHLSATTEFTDIIDLIVPSLNNASSSWSYKLLLSMTLKNTIHIGSITQIPIDYSVSKTVREMFLLAVKGDVKVEKTTKKGFGFRGNKKEKSSSGEDNDRQLILHNILSIWSNPFFIFKNSKNGCSLDDISDIIKELVSMTLDNSDNIRLAASIALVRFFDPCIVPFWNGCFSNRVDLSDSIDIAPEETTESKTRYWKLASLALFLISKQIIHLSNPDTLKNYSLLRELALLSCRLLRERNKFIGATKLGYLDCQIQERYAANVSLETAFLILLTSADVELSKISLLCLESMTDEAITADRDNVSNEVTVKLESIPMVENLLAYIELKQYVNSSNPSIQSRAHQKELRNALKLVKKVTPSLILAWQEIYRRWKSNYQFFSSGSAVLSSAASVSAMSTTTGGTEEEEAPSKKKNRLQKLGNHLDSRTDLTQWKIPHQEWLNYQGFLFSLVNTALQSALRPTHSLNRRARSGVLINDAIDDVERSNGSICTIGLNNSDDEKSSDDAAWRIQTSDKSPSINHDVIDKFIRELFELVIGDNLSVRDSTREMLGSEMTGSVCVAIYKNLELLGERLVDAQDQPQYTDKNMISLDTILCIVLLLFNRLPDVYQGDTSENQKQKGVKKYSLNLSSLCLQIVEFLHKSSGQIATDICDGFKIRCCKFISYLYENRDIVGIDNEVSWKNSVLMRVIQWNRVFVTNHNKRLMLENEQALELDNESLNATVLLLDGLELLDMEKSKRSSMMITKDESKKEMFVKYFQLFLKALQTYKKVETSISRTSDVGQHSDSVTSKNKKSIFITLKNNTILGLCRLISSNMDVGITHLLEIAYDQDFLLRRILIEVLTEILKKEEQQKIELKHINVEHFFQLLMKEPFLVLQGFAEVAPVNEADEIVGALLELSQHYQKTVPILSYMIRLEVLKTDDVTCIFRRNSITSKVLSAFGKKELKKFLNETVGESIRYMLQHPEITYEVDPTKLSNTESADSNIINLQRITMITLNSIIENIQNIPESIRSCCSIMHKLVSKKFQGSELLAVGGYIFLRLIGPAIISPESFGITKEPINNKEIRRGLVLVSKIIQNMANDVLFGNKESFMVTFNPLLKDNRVKLLHFLESLCNSPFNSNTVAVESTDIEDHQFKLIKSLSSNYQKISLYVSTMDPKDATEFSNLIFEPPSNQTEKSSEMEHKERWIALIDECSIMVNHLSKELSPRGILINVAFANFCAPDGALRFSSYKLLCKLSNSLLGSPVNLVALDNIPDYVIPQNTVNFLVDMSKSIAAFDKDVTFEFLSESLGSFSSYDYELKSHAAYYMSPWLPNITTIRSPAKRDQIIKALIYATVGADGGSVLQIYSYMWGEIGKVSSLITRTIQLLIEEMEKLNLTEHSTEVLGGCILAMASKNSEVIHHFMKLCQETLNTIVEDPKRPELLLNHSLWVRLTVYIRVISLMIFNNVINLHIYLPQIFYTCLSTIGSGTFITSRIIYSIILGTCQFIMNNNQQNPETLNRISLALKKLQNSSIQRLCGLTSSSSSKSVKEIRHHLLDEWECDGNYDSSVAINITEVDIMGCIMWDILKYGAPSQTVQIDWKNTWKALNESHLSMRFDRSFIGISNCYHDSFDKKTCNNLFMLLKDEFLQFRVGKSSTISGILLAIGRSLDRSLPPEDELYIVTFWILMQVLIFGEIEIFKTAIRIFNQLIEETLLISKASGSNIFERIKSARDKYLLTNQLELECKIIYDDQFSNYISTILLKGLTNTETKSASEKALLSLMKLYTKDCNGSVFNTPHSNEEALGYIIPLISSENSLGELFKKINSSSIPIESIGSTSEEVNDRANYSRLLTHFMEQSEYIKMTQLNILFVMLEQNRTEAAMLQITKFLVQVVDRCPDMLMKIYKNVETLLISIGQKVGSVMLRTSLEKILRKMSRGSMREKSQVVNPKFLGILQESTFTKVHPNLQTRSVLISNNLDKIVQKYYC
ncbi:hypothetical protein BC833DRAFT_599920 [Globomyces pollinis-pini]|nr:hypothetical protein BC833DRAFT_599920 [Globomyces pollinis-pini]